MRLALIAAAFVAATLPAASNTRSAAAPRTLVRIDGRIRGFAQDGMRLAWLTGANTAHCTRVLHVRSLATRKTQTAVERGCTTTSEGASNLALAGPAAAWDAFVAGGNTEFDYVVMTARIPERRAHRVAYIHGVRDYGYPDAWPQVAGAGNLLAFTTQTAVRRVLRGVSSKLFPLTKPLALAVGGGRIAVLRQELLAGDGCGCAGSPVWFATGAIGFLTRTSAPNEAEVREISMIAPDGSGRTVLSHDAAYRWGLDWTRDGARVAYSHFAGGVPTVAVAAPDGSGAHDLVPGTEPAWSPDGTRIAYTASVAGATSVHVIGADGNGERTLWPGSGATWSPDAMRIAGTTRDGYLTIGPADGSSAPQSLPTRGFRPDWSPDGTRLVFDRGEGPGGGIWVVGADGAGLHALTSGWDVDPNWSPDGQTIVFVSARNDILDDDAYPGLELFLVGADGSNIRPLTVSVPNRWATLGQLRIASGGLVARFEAAGIAAGVALAAERIVVLTLDAQRHGSIFVFSASGQQVARAAVPGTFPVLAGATSRWVVYRSGGTIRALDLRSHEPLVLAGAVNPVGLSVSGRRVAWGENLRSASRARIRALTLPR